MSSTVLDFVQLGWRILVMALVAVVELANCFVLQDGHLVLLSLFFLGFLADTESTFLSACSLI